MAILSRFIHSTSLTFTRYVHSNKTAEVKRTLKKLLKYTFVAFGGCVVAASSLFVYTAGKWKLRGADIILKDRLNLGLPVIRYKDCAFDFVCALRRDQVENFRVREDDIFLVTYPRSGTTRLQEVIFLIVSDLDFEEARNKILDDRFPLLDAWYPGMKTIDSNPSPRLLKTHYPYQLLPTEVKEKKPKIVYCARNPKDVVVSQYFHVYSFSSDFRKPTIEDAFDSFMRNTGSFTPWWSHVLGFWQRRDDENILFITYEEMNQSIKECVHRVARFLGKTLTDAEVEKITEHCRIENMRQNKSANFSWLGERNRIMKYVIKPKKPTWIRKGIIGDWKNHLTPEMSDAIDELVDEKFQGTGLEFPECGQKSKNLHVKE